jgi:hypothetical protein
MTISTRALPVMSGVLAGGLAVSGLQSASLIDQLTVPAGFRLSVFAENVENAGRW